MGTTTSKKIAFGANGMWPGYWQEQGGRKRQLHSDEAFFEKQLGLWRAAAYTHLQVPPFQSAQCEPRQSGAGWGWQLTLAQPTPSQPSYPSRKGNQSNEFALHLGERKLGASVCKRGPKGHVLHAGELGE